MPEMHWQRLGIFKKTKNKKQTLCCTKWITHLRCLDHKHVPLLLPCHFLPWMSCYMFISLFLFKTAILICPMPMFFGPLIKTEPNHKHGRSGNPPLLHDSKEPTETLITDTYNDWLQDCADSSAQTAVN